MDLNSSPRIEREERRHGGRMDQRGGIWNQNREDRNRLTKRKYPHDHQWNVSRPSTHYPAYHNRNSRPCGGNTLPPGWLDCPAYGEEIGYIIPSKVPLGESFNDYILGKNYTPKQAIDQQRHFGRELGLVIDLTNTDRYYPISDWKDEGIDYVKIRCQGRDSVPDHESVDKFLDEVSRFFTRQVHPKKYILVHCTHGHNRTGYMIVHYLVRSESISVTEAITTFARARQPGIYKEDYIHSLYMFYNERKPETVVCPPTPEWKSLPNPDTDGASFSTYNNSGKSSSLEDAVTGNIMTSDDILGDPIPSNQQQSMRQKCYQLLQLGAGAKGLLQFPGSHPVSLNSDNLQLLRQRYYYATWKADGTRYMMLIMWDGCYLIDRKFNFQRVQMRFPCQSNQGTAENTHHYTLLDGEMIIDTDPQTGKQERRYLIYDMMAINDDSVVELPFCERWKMLEKEVIEPRNAERETLSRTKTPYYRYDLEPFSVRRKAFWLLSTVSKLLKNFIPQLSHAADGLVFQGWDDPYVPRTHQGLLKWKYPEMNSVDFLFELGADMRPRLFVHERGKKKLMDKTRVVFKDTSDYTVYSGKIIECSWNPEGYHWVCMRIRVDKSTPNEFNTFRKVLRSIKDNITEDILLNEIDQIIRLPMYADRIQNDIKAHQHMVAARRK